MNPNQNPYGPRQPYDQQSYGPQPNPNYQQQYQQPPYQQPPYQQQYNQQQYNQQQGQQPYYNGCPVSQAWLRNDLFADGPSGKNRGIFCLLLFFLGAFGVHYFYIGKYVAGIVTFCAFWGLTIFTCGYAAPIPGLILLIQFFVVLCGNNQRFEEDFVNPMKTFPMF